MSEPASDPFHEAARKLTRLRIASSDVAPHAVSAELPTRTASVSKSPFEMAISRAVLHHELREAGAIAEGADLRAFVEQDIAKHPQTALAGYLTIARAILNTQEPKRKWSLFARAEPVGPIKWELVDVERIVADAERLVIHGTAIRVGA